MTCMTQDELTSYLNGLTDVELQALLHDWRFWARPNQVWPDGDWYIWLIIAGRGWGKSRTGAEAAIEAVQERGYNRLALVARTSADVRDVMVEGESGILAKSPHWFMPTYEPSKRRLTWPNGAIATTYSGDKPDQLRGPQHDFAWVDELASWRYMKDAWSNLLFGLRLGKFPRIVGTTTPRPLQLLIEMIADPRTHVTRGHTYENLANLSSIAVNELKRRYEGTRLGRQELAAEILTDIPGALWTRAILELCYSSTRPDMKRVGVSVDPAITSGEEANETGIIIGGLGADDYGYVLDDRSMHGRPDEWARVAVGAYHEYEADVLLVEDNQGGEMVEYTIKTIDKHVHVKRVHAKRGKYLRAEPVAAMYEQGRVKHYGVFAELEDQMCTWTKDDPDSPDRIDAAVQLFTELMLDRPSEIQQQPNPFWK